MPTTEIDPRDLGPNQIGQTIKVTWRQSNVNADSVMQGQLLEVRHFDAGGVHTLVKARVGPMTMEPDLYAASSVEIVG